MKNKLEVKNKIKALEISIVAIIICGIFYYIAQILKFPYMQSSLIKITLFLIVPSAYFIIRKKKEVLQNMFKIKSIKEIKLGLILVSILILIASSLMLLVYNIDEFRNLAMQAGNTINKTLNNFIITSLYIVCINAFLEEFFFRGIVFLELNKTANKTYAMIFSAILFSLYHLAIFQPGMEPFMYIIGYIILFFTGLIFNYIDSHSKNIYNSWIVHAAANMSINLFGIYILINLK